VASANSALQRARATMQERLPRRRADWPGGTPNAEERALLDRFMESFERGDAAAALHLLAKDIRVTMPPYPWCYDGLQALKPLMDRARREGEWQLVPTWANRMPAAGNYLRRPDDSRFRAFKLDVLRVEDGVIAEITTFGPDLFPVFRLDPEL
jgi:ketosteroid isomerase-like protein